MVLKGKGRGRNRSIGLSAGKGCKLHTLVSLTRCDRSSPISVADVTEHRSVSRQCLRRLVSGLGGTKLIGDVQNTGNKCILTGRTGSVSMKSILHTLRKGLRPMRYTKLSPRKRYGNTSDYIAGCI